MPLHPVTGKPCSKGEFDSVTAQLKKEAKKEPKQPKAATAGGGSSKGKTKAELANDAAVEELIKEVKSHGSADSLSCSFGRVTAIDGDKVTIVSRSGERVLSLSTSLLKENGKCGVRVLEIGSIVGVRSEVVYKMRSCLTVKGPAIAGVEPPSYTKETIPFKEHETRIFCVIPAEYNELLKLE